MNKQGSVMIEILAMLTLVVLTSGVMLALVSTGVITVGAASQEPILNTEFIPLGREGVLNIKEFQFCTVVNAAYQCLEPKETFNLGEQVHFRFVVESSTHYGDIMLVENYRVKGPNGEVFLDVEEENNFNFDLKSVDSLEEVTFKDFFTANQGLPLGEYTLELVVTNPLLNKKVTKSERFVLR